MSKLCRITKSKMALFIKRYLKHSMMYGNPADKEKKWIGEFLDKEYEKLEEVEN